MFEKKVQVVANTTEKVIIDQSGKYIIELIGPGAHADLDGRFLLRGKDTANIEVYIVHKAPHTTAHTMLKGVVFDYAQLRFFGRIIIDPGCPNTQSFLEERILLMSNTAKAEAVPELEILSDDVKCSHAASISRVPEEHVFYLQSRGVKPELAEQLVIEGFLEKEE